MTQGYTHKKFNCGYSHKKLGLRLRQREQTNNENETSAQTEPIKRSKNLFRPYALDDNNTPRKRKISSPQVSMENNDLNTPAVTSEISSAVSNLQDQQQEQQDALNFTTTTYCPTATTPPHFVNYFALSPNSYNIRLQRQRAALYNYYMGQVETQQAAATLQTATGYPMGYPNVTAPIFNRF